MKVREGIRLIEEDGWRFHSQKGSHRQYKHPVKSGRVRVPGNPRRGSSNIKEAIEFHLEGMRKDGLPIPEPTTEVDYAEVG